MGLLDGPLQRASQLSIDTVLTFAINGTISSAALIAGRTAIRVAIPALWTAANLTIQLSADNVTWFDLYDEFGTLYVIVAAGSRIISITPSALLAVTYIRFRSGTVALPVAQTSATSITVTSQPV